MEQQVMQTWGRIKDLYGYHKRFSSFQKIVIISLLVGFASIFYSRLLTVVVVYILVVVATIIACHVLSSVQTNYTFGVSILLFVTRHETIFNYIFCLLELLKTKPSASKFDSKVNNGLDSAHEEFQDAKEHDEETLGKAEQIMAIGKGKNETPMNSEEEVNHTPTGEHKMKSLDELSSWKDEVELFSCLVSKDFVKPWYDTFSSASDDVLEEMHIIINTCFLELCDKFQHVDSYALLTDILIHYRQHLRMFQVARTLYKTQPRRRLSQRRLSSSQHLSRRINSVEDAFEIKFSYHTAVWGDENEIIYFRSVVQILLSQLLSGHLHVCNTSYLLFVEIFTCNIFLPVIELLSDSDFLYECIIKILSDEEVGSVEDHDISEILLDRNLEISKMATHRNACQNDVQIIVSDHLKEVDGRDQNKHGTLENCHPGNRSLRSDMRLRRSSSASSTQELLNFKNLNDASNEKKDELYDYGEENSLENKGNGNSLYCDKGQSAMARSCPSHLGIVSAAGVSDSEDFSAESSATEDEDVPSKVRVYLDSDEVEKMEEVELPNMLFVDVSITDTETRQEMRSSAQYTLYNIQYDALYSTEANSLELRTRSVKRRFREFVNLQARLEDNDAYRKSLKDVKGPRRWLSLPFGNMDKKSVEGRRKSLEKFLRSLIQKLDICNGSELKEFLAYEGDGHIAFVRKAPEISVSRIDKMIVKTMSDVFDKIGELSNKAQEVLPKLPGKKDNSVSEDDGKPAKDLDLINVDFSTESQVSGFQGKLIHYMRKQGSSSVDMESPTTPVNEDQVAAGRGTETVAMTDDKHRDQSSKPLTEDSAYEATEDIGMATDEVESSALKAETPNVLQGLDDTDVQTHLKQKTADSQDSVGRGMESEEKDTVMPPDKTDVNVDDVALAEAVIDLAIQALQGHDCWVTRDRVVSLTKHLAGTALHRFLMMKLDTLTTEQMCRFYIRTLRETLWPNSELSLEGRKVKTDKQKAATKEQARRVLAEFLPDVLKQIVGSEDYQFSIDEIIESVEHQKLNRNFMCTFLDHLIEKLFPNTSSAQCLEDILN
ncbi:sorting nexin-19-like [Argopecten irradians]|uniref:sorting nexin-19-like n=1 Tax=Argopecten irradians TaxID=31199 RepID=UPI003711CEE1